ncbi:hypothetical protein EIP91_003616 [Steccherinum ochraceum]|uniref:F-box domain-containing protein n=1 Tax=Steccherinum ochraceum TaxID=92696 RepID=A0A4R0RQW8_9APHY|nr:hypothetical protein EIP91_003616 [Steccherinum ochraceum]
MTLSSPLAPRPPSPSRAPIHGLAPELLLAIIDDLPLSSILSFALTSRRAYDLCVVPLNRHVVITQSNVPLFRARLQKGDWRNALVREVSLGRTDRQTIDRDPWDASTVADVVAAFPNLRSLKTKAFVQVFGRKGLNCIGETVGRLDALQARIKYPEEEGRPSAPSPKYIFANLRCLDLQFAVSEDTRGFEQMSPNLSHFFPNLVQLCLRCHRELQFDEYRNYEPLFPMLQQSFFPELKVCHLVSGNWTIHDEEMRIILDFMARHKETVEDLALPRWVYRGTLVVLCPMKLRKLRTTHTLLWQLGRCLGTSTESLAELYVDGVASGRTDDLVFRFQSSTMFDEQPGWPFLNVKTLTLAPEYEMKSDMLTSIPYVCPNIDELIVNTTSILGFVFSMSDCRFQTLQLTQMWVEMLIHGKILKKGGTSTKVRWNRLQRITFHHLCISGKYEQTFTLGKEPGDPVQVIKKEESILAGFGSYA